MISATPSGSRTTRARAGCWLSGVGARSGRFGRDRFAAREVNHKGFVLKYKYAVTDFFSAGVTYMDSDLIDEDYTAPVVAKDERIDVSVLLGQDGKPVMVGLTNFEEGDATVQLRWPSLPVAMAWS